ncbi:hypothetical protein GLOIN_2v1848952 [Rhizophagus clarus]|uniref:Uncharacterized protein n=1 Tax=Rhizophagus clarus TaxID=94130 RepID=A0A8H3L8U6_9GLOM|nr:hypothetical protein GLOIN_2v1848952 [Rhizophagus clarus]
MVVFTHTNALAKDFQNDRKKCQVICCEDDAQPPPFFGEMPHSWLKEQADYYEKVLTDYRAKCSRLQELKKKMRRQNNRMQSDLFHEVLPITEKWEYLEREPKDGRKQNCLILIPGSSEKKELVKNDIIHLPLNTLPDKFLKDMLADKKVIDWELGYAMTIHTSQGMTLKAPQSVWIEAPPLPPEIAQEIEEAKKNRQLEHELRPSIQEKLIGYMG